MLLHSLISASLINRAHAVPVSMNHLRRADQSKVVEFELHRAIKHDSDTIKISNFPHYVTADSHVEVQLANQQYYYQIKLDIGNPPQTVDFTIDTGSSDLWVMAASNPYCTTNSSNTTGINCNGSVFDPELSSTYHSLKTPFSIEYGDHTMANGTLSRDTVRIGSSLLTNATFAVAEVVNSSTCVFGIGFIGNEAGAHVHRNGSGVYPTYFNVPTLMKSQDIIGTNAYSLWLNDGAAKSGSILFGGVDRAKYEGDLTVMPVYNNYFEYTDRPIQTRVMFNSIRIEGIPLAEFSIAVLLDSGTSFSYLPEKLVHAIGSALGFVYREELGYYIGGVNSAISRVNTLQLDFSGAIIDVTTTDLLVNVLMDDGVSPVLINGDPQAILAMGVAEDDYMYILGDVFLRSMYAVFDIDHYEIALANAKRNVTDTDIVTIGASIPGAIQAPGYFHTTANNASFNVFPFNAVKTAQPTATSFLVGTNTTLILDTTSAHDTTLALDTSTSTQDITLTIKVDGSGPSAYATNSQTKLSSSTSIKR